MAATEYTISRTQRGDLPYLKASGKPFRIRASSIFEIEDGKIRRETRYYNVAHFLAQLGGLDSSVLSRLGTEARRPGGLSRLRDGNVPGQIASKSRRALVVRRLSSSISCRLDPFLQQEQTSLAHAFRLRAGVWRPRQRISAEIGTAPREVLHGHGIDDRERESCVRGG